MSRAISKCPHSDSITALVRGEVKSKLNNTHSVSPSYRSAPPRSLLSTLLLDLMLWMVGLVWSPAYFRLR